MIPSRNIIRHTLLLLVSIALLQRQHCHAQDSGMHTFNVKNPSQLREFFTFTPDAIPFISAHRGGAAVGFPENCIATFENTLSQTHAILEIDPRLTKDSVIVLMHDATLDRTTNGSGNVSDHTWEELKQLKLKDVKGNLTSYQIPTLDEVLAWAKGKTILILDKKSVPLHMTERKIREYRAESWAMVMAYSFDEARQYHNMNKDIMMEVFIPNREKLAQFGETGVPWKNIVAFIAHALPEDKGLYKEIHDKGVMCIVGSSRIYDKQYASGDRQVYDKMLAEGVDIIEADLASEAGNAIEHLRPARSVKSKFFHSAAN